MRLLGFVNDNESFLSRSGYMLNWIKKEMKSGLDWRFKFVRRQHNEIAHLLAKVQSSPANSLDWVSSKVKKWLQGLRSRDR